MGSCSKQPDFIRRTTAAVETVVPGTRTFAYGHFGDGNVHFNLCAPKGVEAAAFMARAADLHRAVYDIAAEHGVGIVKLAEMERQRSAVELDLDILVRPSLPCRAFAFGIKQRVSRML